MLTNYKSCIIWLFGAISGFTLMISGNTLNYWLAKEQIDIRTIGIFACISLPYAVNFVWAPVFDIKSLGYLSRLLGHRLSWICLLQLLLAFFVLLLSMLSPGEDLFLFGVVGFIASLLSSAQDTVLGALRTEIIDTRLQGAASGVYIFGYRTGMLCSSSGAIYLSSKIGWHKVYMIFALVIASFPLILIFVLNIKNKCNSVLSQISINDVQRQPGGVLLLLRTALVYIGLFRESRHPYNNDKISGYCAHRFNIINFITSILSPIGSRSYLIIAIAFLILYRLPDNFLNIMINPFLISLGYDEFEIASIGKFFGISSAIIGGLIAGFIMQRCNIAHSLLIFGIVHCIAHSLFIVHAATGYNVRLLFIIMGVESITGGMAMAAYIAFIASLCSGKFRATQYAFFSSMMGFSRSIFPAVSGYLVLEFGWQKFFLLITVMTIPSLLLAFKLIMYEQNRTQIPS